ncbi:alpha/beta fold hydrolase [Chitinophagaceae bacterium MMS25-I14]
MSTVSGYIQAGSQQLHYLRSGKGQELLLCFHGYGNDAGIFNELTALVADRFTILSFDLPHHGKSTGWPVEEPFEKAQLEQLVLQSMQLVNADRCALLGYSMGGRVCLQVLELMPEKVKQALLVAPDGLVFNTFYYFVTHSTIGKTLFRKLIGGPQRNTAFVGWLRKMKLLDASRYKFVMHYLSSPQSREMLLKVWPAMRFILPDTDKVRKNISVYHIPVHIFMGRYDRVIPVKLAESFRKGQDNIYLHIIDRGHNLFDVSSIRQMADCLH